MEWLLLHWPVKLVSVTLILAAYIDGLKLKVPNWITFPMILSGWVFGFCSGGWEGLQASLWGTGVGLACLYPLYAVGGMGAGDVKLLAGIGAWLGGTVTWHAFLATVVVGAIMSVIMVIYRREVVQHVANFFMILNEFCTIRSPSKLFDIAAERKPRMLLLPYGIPMCIGTIGYFVATGMI